MKKRGGVGTCGDGVNVIVVCTCHGRRVDEMWVCMVVHRCTGAVHKRCEAWHVPCMRGVQMWRVSCMTSWVRHTCAIEAHAVEYQLRL